MGEILLNEQGDGILSNEEGIRDVWKDGAFGSSTRSLKFKPNFLNSKKKKGRKFPDEDIQSESILINKNEIRYLKEVGRIKCNGNKLTIIESHLNQLFNTDPPTKIVEEKDTNLTSSTNNEKESIDTKTTLTHDEKESPQYQLYKKFRTNGWVPKNGLAYGSDYVLYKTDPDKSHSKYCVSLLQKKMNNLQLLRNVRLAEHNKKRFVLFNENQTGIQFKRWILKHEHNN